MAVNTKMPLTNTADGYLCEGTDIRGGYFVIDKTENIPSTIAKTGSLCYCTNDKKFYQYNGTVWEEAKLGSSISEGANINITEDGQISLKDEITLTKVSATTVSTDMLETPTVLQDGDTLSIADPDGNMVAQIDGSGIETTEIHADCSYFEEVTISSQLDIEGAANIYNLQATSISADNILTDELTTSYIKYNSTNGTDLSIEAQEIVFDGNTLFDGHENTFNHDVIIDNTLRVNGGTINTYDDMSNWSQLTGNSFTLNCYDSDIEEYRYATLDEAALKFENGNDGNFTKLFASGQLRRYADEESPSIIIGATNSLSSFRNGRVNIKSSLTVDNDTSIRESLTVTGETQFNGEVYCNSYLNLASGDLTLSSQYFEADDEYRLLVNGKKVLLDGDDYSGEGVEDGILNTETLSIVSKDTTIGTSLTTIATIDGIDIKAKVDSQTIIQAPYAGTDGADIPILLGEGTTQNVNLGTVYVKAGTNGITVNPSNGQLKAGSFYAWSDRRLKENIKEYKPEKSILDLPVVEFDFKESGNHQIGCIAQDLQELFPDLVSAGTDGYLSINENKLVYLLLLEVKKLREELNEFKNNEKN